MVLLFRFSQVIASLGEAIRLYCAGVVILCGRTQFAPTGDRTTPPFGHPSKEGNYGGRGLDCGERTLPLRWRGGAERRGGYPSSVLVPRYKHGMKS